MRTAVSAAVVVAIVLSGCGSVEESTTPVSDAETHSGDPVASTTETESPPDSVSHPAWVEEDVSFGFGPDELFGVLALPPGQAPHPAIVLLSGSGDAAGVRAGSTSKTFVDHSRRLAAEGFAVLRYDPPGVGQSSGGGGLPSLDERTQETYAAIQFLQTRPEIDGARIGLQGWSQGPWVMAMTTVRYPQDVAFLVSVVGSGQSVAHQQVYGIRAQSQAAGLSEEEISKAVVFGQLLLDWQLPEPMFEDASKAALPTMPDGPWNTFAELVYEPGDIDPAQSLKAGIELLGSIKDEPWAEALYLDLYLARLESIPAGLAPEEVAALQAVMAENLTTDPKDFLTEVQVPLLAFFGEHDPNVDSQISPALFDKYLSEAGNEDYTIVVIPDVGHDIGLSTPGYWDPLAEWLDSRFAS